MSLLGVVACCVGAFLLGAGAAAGLLAWFTGAVDRLPDGPGLVAMPDAPAEVGRALRLEPTAWGDVCLGCGERFDTPHRADCPYWKPYPQHKVDHVQTCIEPVQTKYET